MAPQRRRIRTVKKKDALEQVDDNGVKKQQQQKDTSYSEDENLLKRALTPSESSQPLHAPVRRSPRLLDTRLQVTYTEPSDDNLDDSNELSAENQSMFEEGFLSDLQLSLLKRRQQIRKKYVAAAKSLRTRIEMRIHRIPPHLRSMTIAELQERLSTNKSITN
ncbi:hypothetical protein V1512DRAFT_290236 [Lipomyces arxii]|uniref:uncharacterized protein n=1 Tax=Lipomyces arxii TaxID=56418 RepID=UPI0034CFD9BC